MMGLPHITLDTWESTWMNPSLTAGLAYTGMRGQPCYVTAVHSCVMYSAWNPNNNYDMSASVFVVQFNGFMSLTS